jgi:hypothetical protein
MERQYHEALGIQRFFLDLFERCALRERAFGQTYAYVNPWHAAMDEEIENARVRSAHEAAERRAAKNRAERIARSEAPAARL